MVAYQTLEQVVVVVEVAYQTFEEEVVVVVVVEVGHSPWGQMVG